MQILISFVYIAHIRAYAVSESTNMIKGMITQTVTTRLHHLELVRMLTYVIAYHKEGSLDAIMVEHIEHPRGHLRYRTIIERKIYSTFVFVHSPKRTRIEPSQKAGGLFYNHG